MLLFCNSCERATERLEQFPVFGIDISHHQSKVNWDTLAAQNVQFAFVKVTEGKRHVDSFYMRNWLEMKRVNIKRGAYHFFRPAIAPELQAQNFINNVLMEYGDLPPVLDFEVTDEQPREVIIAQMKIWLRLIEVEYSVKPIIYTHYKFYNQYIAGEFDTYPIWIAKYGSTEPKLAANTNWIFWQYGNRGTLRGIAGYVDFNAFYGSAEQLDSLCISGATLSDKLSPRHRKL